jgi:hypothetical protein
MHPVLPVQPGIQRQELPERVLQVRLQLPVASVHRPVRRLAAWVRRVARQQVARRLGASVVQPVAAGLHWWVRLALPRAEAAAGPRASEAVARMQSSR